MAVFGDLNNAEVLGNITQDIELRYTPNGNAVTNLSIATNRSYKQGEEWKDEATFHNIVVWGNDAEQLNQRARKGTRIYIQGRLQTRSWEDADGKKNYRTEIVASKLILLDRFERASSEASSTTTQKVEKSDTPTSKKSSKPSAKKESKSDDVIDPDDLPF